MEAQALCCNVSASTTWHLCFFPPSQHPLLLLLLALLEARQEMDVTTGRLILLTVVAELGNPE